MKNKDQHKGLKHAGIRDFLSKSLKYSYEGEVEIIEEQMKKLQANLERAKTYQASYALVQSKGWEYFDSSDECEDYRDGHYTPFVGTEEEFSQMCNNIRKEN